MRVEEILNELHIKLLGSYYSVLNMSCLYEIEINNRNYRITKENGLYKVYEVLEKETLEQCSSGNILSVKNILKAIKERG